jgi:hypothetical protein
MSGDRVYSTRRPLCLLEFRPAAALGLRALHRPSLLGRRPSQQPNPLSKPDGLRHWMPRTSLRQRRQAATLLCRRRLSSNLLPPGEDSILRMTCPQAEGGRRRAAAAAAILLSHQPLCGPLQRPGHLFTPKMRKLAGRCPRSCAVPSRRNRQREIVAVARRRHSILTVARHHSLLRSRATARQDLSDTLAERLSSPLTPRPYRSQPRFQTQSVATASQS